jgi:transposase
MGEVSTIGLDIAKSVFQIHGVDADGTVVIRKRVSRAKILEYFSDLPPCVVGIEACATAHHWSRELQGLGHAVRLMPPSYVKAYLKRSKNDANDAAAICEAVARPTMRFVPIKSEADQATLMLHRLRASFVEKRTAAANQLRAAFAEFGITAAVGAGGFKELLGLIESKAESFALLPQALRLVLSELAWQWQSCEAAVRRMDVEIAAGVKTSERAKRRSSGLAVIACVPHELADELHEARYDSEDQERNVQPHRVEGLVQ